MFSFGLQFDLIFRFSKYCKTSREQEKAFSEITSKIIAEKQKVVGTQFKNDEESSTAYSMIDEMMKDEALKDFEIMKDQLGTIMATVSFYS